MVVIPSVLVAGGLFTLATAAPFRAAHSHAKHHLAERSGDVYVVYGGDGTTAAGWPAQSAWVSDFDTMYVRRLPSSSLSPTRPFGPTTR